MVNSYILLVCNSCVELSHAWTMPQKLTSSIYMDSITKIMYTCIPKLELGGPFLFWHSTASYFTYLCVSSICASCRL